MYTKDQVIIRPNAIELKTYMEGTDIFNSKFLYMFRKLPSRGTYKIENKDFRIDLISQDIFVENIYGELLLIYNGITINELKKGITLRTFDIVDLNTLVTKINNINSPTEFIKTIKL